MKNSNMKCVLIAGWVGSENSGDEAILAANIALFKSRGLTVSAFSTNPRKTEEMHSIQAIPFDILPRPLRFIRAIRESDIMVVGGGGILQDQTSIFNTPRYVYKALLGKLFRKKVIWFAVGAGPISFGLTRWLVKHTLNVSDAVTVRDEESGKLLRSIGVHPGKLTVSFDPVINLKSTVPPDDVMSLQNERPLIGVCLRHWYDTNPFIPVSLAQKLGFRQGGGRNKYEMMTKMIARSLDTLIESDKATIYFIPFWFNRDSHVHHNVESHMKHRTSVSHLPRELHPRQLLGLFKQLDTVISMRLHASIYASNVNVPYVPLSYSKKTDSFAREAGADDVLINLDELKSDTLTQKVRLSLKKRDQKMLVEALRYKEQLNAEVFDRLIQ